MSPEEIYGLNYDDIERLLGGKEQEEEEDVDSLDSTVDGNTQDDDSQLNESTDEEHTVNEPDRTHTEL